MTAKLYSSYKDSGSIWLNKVPAHWKVAPLKRLLNIQNGADQKAVEYEEGYPIYGSGGIFGYANQYLYDGKSVLLGRKGTIDKPLFVDGKFWTVDTMYWSKILPTADPKFSYYLATRIPFDFYSTSTALPSMTKADLGSHIVAYPEVEEQQRIANYLDRETAKIDELIQKQKELIELSEKRKKQLTLETLTFGVRKNTDTKSSNLPWAPKIPSNWGVYALKRIASMQSGSSITAEHIEEDGLYPVFGGGGFRGYTSEYTHEGIYPLIGRQGALCGNVNFSKDKFWASEHAVVVSPMKNIDPIWLGLLLRSMNLGQYSMSAAQPGLSVDVIKNLLAPIPPYEEQLEISNFLNKEYSKIEALIGKSQLSIKLLSEHRASLISAAVTGKIMVTE